MAVPPPAPVPTTIASYTLVANERSSLVLAGLDWSASGCRLPKVRVFGIVGMRAAGIAGHTACKPGIAKALQSNLGRVVADNGVIAHHLEKRAPALRRRV